MFGSVRYVFHSRWRALMWSCGVLVTAYCSVPSENEGSDAMSAEQAQQAEAAVRALAGQPAHEARQHKNPWALNKSDGPAAN